MKNGLQDKDDKLHGRKVIIVQQNFVKRWSFCFCLGFGGYGCSATLPGLLRHA
jgi:hypothetical protein